MLKEMRNHICETSICNKWRIIFEETSVYNKWRITHAKRQFTTNDESYLRNVSLQQMKNHIWGNISL